MADYVITLRRDVSQFISSTRLTKTRALIKDVFTSIWDEAEFRARADEKDDDEENRQREEAVRLLERALILFLPSILEKDIKETILRFMISKDSELRAVGTKIRWNEVKERILQETQKVSTTWPIINALATGRRKTGVRLLEWVAEVHHLKVQLELTGGTLREDFWFHYVWKRLTDTERHG